MCEFEGQLTVLYNFPLPTSLSAVNRDCHGWSSIIATHKEFSVFTFKSNDMRWRTFKKNNHKVRNTGRVEPRFSEPQSSIIQMTICNRVTLSPHRPIEFAQWPGWSSPAFAKCLLSMCMNTRYYANYACATNINNDIQKAAITSLPSTMHHNYGRSYTHSIYTRMHNLLSHTCTPTGTRTCTCTNTHLMKGTKVLTLGAGHD